MVNESQLPALIAEQSAAPDRAECILVVDDSDSLRHLLTAEVLPHYGYETLAAADGREGLRLIAEEQPDLVLLDLQLPDISGIEILKEMKRQGQDVPVILITAHGSESIAAQAFRLGVRDYLIKPFNMKMGHTTIQRVLDQARLQREKERLSRELEEARRDLEQRLRELTVLVGISKSVTSQLDVDQVLDRVVEGAVFITKAEEGGLWLLEAATDRLWLKAERGLDEERATLESFNPEESLVGQVLRASEPIRAVGESDLAGVEVSEDYAVAALLSVPLQNKGRSIGVLTVANREERRPFTGNNVATLQALADYASIAIENAQTYQAADEALAQRVAEVTHLYDITRTVTSTLDQEQIFDLVTARIREMFRVEAGSLLMLDEDTQELEFVASQLGERDPPRGLRIEVDKGIAGHVALTQQPMIVNDAYNLSEFYREVDQLTGFITRSILCVPLMVQDRCIGVLELLNKHNGAFTQEDLEKLRNVAGSVAIALENARLFREAQNLNEDKSRFMAALAQELRSPLTAIKGYSIMALSEAEQPHGGASTSIDRIEESTEHLINLMEDLLDITRLETGETQLDLQPVSISQIVAQISSAFEQRLTERSLRLTTKVNGRLPSVYGDQERISQVLKSLVTNAYQYTLPKGRLAIGAQRHEPRPGLKVDGEWIVVSVSDTGIGIAPEDQPRVYERFFRANHPVVRHHQGRGLSLYICQVACGAAWR